MRINPLMNPYFRPQETGDAQMSLGSGAGYDWMQGLANLPGANAFYTPGVNAGDASSDPSINADALQAYLDQMGYSLNEQPLPGNSTERWIADASGGDVGAREQFSYDDPNFEAGAALAAALVTGGVASWANPGLFGAAAGGGGLNSAIAQGALSGGAVGGGAGALGAAGQLGAGLGALGGTAAAMGGDPSRAALYGAEGYGPGMTGAETSAFGSGGGGMGSSLTDFLTGGGNLSDYARLLQTGVGLYSTNRAADAAQQGQSEANALMREMYTQNRADNQPLLDLRNSTLPQISALMSNPSSITSDPGYQFGLNQGQSQIDNSSAARGGYYSGAQLKASQKYGQDYAGTKLTDSLNRLMGVAGLGQVGATQNQSNNTNYSNMGGNGLMQQGNIRGSGYVGMGNTVNNGIGDWINDWTTRKGPGG